MSATMNLLFPQWPWYVLPSLNIFELAIEEYVCINELDWTAQH